ncbi:MAG TPA: hypothetical protein VLC94_04055 [Candidatus Acidoferrum sp.]|nr:hypothetical protein [Candidatus Acidoferrum sp.]
MKIIVGTMLGLALAGSPLLAGQEPDDKDKPKQEEPKKEKPKPKQEPRPEDRPKPEPRQQPAPRPDDRQKQDDERRKQDEQHRREQPQARNDRDNRQQPQERSHGRGQRIPEERFRVSFGREHHFRVTHHEDRRFQYGGYYFELAEPWPADWIYDDDCIIESDGDDYYLVDIVHPERRVLVIVVEG